MGVARNASLGVMALVGLLLGLLHYRRLLSATKAESGPVIEDAAARLGRLAAEKPQELARLLAVWIDESAATPVAATSRAA